MNSNKCNTLRALELMAIGDALSPDMEPGEMVLTMAARDPAAAVAIHGQLEAVLEAKAEGTTFDAEVPF